MSDSDFALVMPFVVCQSNGGPYEDAAFVAGAQFGQVQAELAAGPFEVEHYVHSALAPQMDLLAMRYGYRFVSEPWDEHPDEWARVTFTKEPTR